MRIKIDKLDALCSEYIRKRAIQRCGGCERCLSPKHDIVKENGTIYPAWKQLQTCHFYSRSKRSVRYDSDNLVGLDFGCHQYLDAHPLEKVEFWKQKLGDRFDLLTIRSNTRQQTDKKAIEIYLKNLIAKLEA